jgi:phospholipase C
VAIDRRDFLKTAAGAGVLGIGNQNKKFGVIKKLLPGPPTKTPVKHIVVVMMENRSVDHYLGWYGKENPAFDARQAITVPDLREGHGGRPISGVPWGQRGLKNFHGRGYHGPDHSWTGGRTELAGGRVDGWLHPSTRNDEFCLGYYDDIDVPVWAQLVRDYQSYDRWHCALMSSTEPNRYYLHSAQAGGMKNNDTPPQVYEKTGRYFTGWDWPTMWTLYDKAHLSAGYYFANLPDLAYWGPRHVNRMRHISHWYEACETGTLPAVSVLAPFFTLNGFGNDDHPNADMRLGEAFLSDVVEAFVNSPQYSYSAMVVTYDEWGGFHDHVAPPRVIDGRGTPKDPGGVDDFGQLGFRIPSSIVSPWTRKPGVVNHSLFEHTSIIKFIADNWHLPYLTVRHRNANSIESAFGGFRHHSKDNSFAPYVAPASAWKDEGAYALNSTIVNETTDPTKVPEVGKIPGSPDWPLPPPFPPPGPIPTGTPPPLDTNAMEGLRDIGWFDKWKIRTDWKIEDSFYRDRRALIADARAAL